MNHETPRDPAQSRALFVVGEGLDPGNDLVLERLRRELVDYHGFKRLRELGAIGMTKPEAVVVEKCQSEGKGGALIALLKGMRLADRHHEVHAGGGVGIVVLGLRRRRDVPRASIGQHRPRWHDDLHA